MDSVPLFVKAAGPFLLLAAAALYGVKKCVFACLVAAPEGIKKIAIDHPDIPIYCAALDRKLNERGYILPGLGDAGDRTFNTTY